VRALVNGDVGVTGHWASPAPQILSSDTVSRITQEWLEQLFVAAAPVVVRMLVEHSAPVVVRMLVEHLAPVVARMLAEHLAPVVARMLAEHLAPVVARMLAEHLAPAQGAVRFCRRDLVPCNRQAQYYRS
jgi:hypothetical protein